MSKVQPLHAILACILLTRTVESKDFNGNNCVKFFLNASTNTMDYPPGSSADLLRLSYDSCLVACGDRTRRFDQLLPRLNIWLFPVLLLLANAQFPTTYRSDSLWTKLLNKVAVSFETLAHILGDPVDYAFTLLSQVETWRECQELARRLRNSFEEDESPFHETEIQNVAIILAAFERVLDHISDREVAGKYFSSIADSLENPGTDMTHEKWTTAIKYEKKIARNFVVVRTRYLAPAVVAIAFYAWQIVGAFVPVIGASPNPSGGRVAAALTLSWIIFMVLFGSTVGGFASHTVYADTIKKYLERRPINLEKRGATTVLQARDKIDQPSDEISKVGDKIVQGAPSTASPRDEIDLAIRACLSTTYYIGYRYHRNAANRVGRGKVLQNRLQRDVQYSRHSSQTLRAIANAPVFVALVSALAVTSLPPTYFSVRHLFFFTIGIMYHIISPASTFILLRMGCGLRGLRWKNAGIAVVMIIVFFVNGCGYFFNNCRGWHTIFPWDQGVVIYSKKDFDRNDFVIFPIIVSLCIATQIALCVIVSMMYSRGFRVMRLAD